MTTGPTPRYHSLDIWRGIACLFVILIHSTAYASHASTFSVLDPASWIITVTERMWIGVSFFFVISGYCITAAAETSIRRGHSTSTYFVRRVRRIFPPYLICFVVCILAVAAAEFLRPGLMCDDVYPFPHPGDLDLWKWLGNITLTEGWRGHFVGQKESCWLLGPAWSLGFEEQFYAITGIILLVSPNRFFTAAAAVSGFVLVLLFLNVGGAGLFIDGRWLLFAAGILVYYCVNHTSSRQRGLLSLPLVLGIFWSLANPMALIAQEKNPWQDGLAAFGFAIVLILLHPQDRYLANSRWLQPLAACGVRCYSIYLVHWPICKVISHLLFDLGVRSPTATVLITVPLCLLASLPIGWVFHSLVERRFLNAPPEGQSTQPTPSVVTA